MNSTDELEARVAVLEESMGNMEEDMDNVESMNLLQEERINEQDDRINGQDNRLNLMEADVSDNENDIEGLLNVFLRRKIHFIWCYTEAKKLFHYIRKKTDRTGICIQNMEI